MKKYLLILLAVFFVFSCKVSPDKDVNKKVNTFFGRSDDDSSLPGSGTLDDEYQAFTSMANAANSIMFVSDGEFIINLKSTKFADDEKRNLDGRNWHLKKVNENKYQNANMLDFSSYETKTPAGNYYFSTDKENWTDICEYFDTKFDSNGFVSSQKSNITIRSELSESGKHFVYFRGEGNSDFRWRFDITLLDDESQIGCYGKLENLLDYNRVESGADMRISKAGLLGTFYSTPIIHAPDIISKEIAEQGCTAIFANCKNLKRAPNILATTLGDSAFYCAFYNCSALETPPETLFAIDLPNYCYTYMFSGCESLKTAPEIKAESVTVSSCESMFEECSSLISAPELKATELSEWCYKGMFKCCISLENAPSVLPSDVIPESGYVSMFEGCTSLKKAPEISASKAMKSSCANMFGYCSSMETAPEVLPAGLDMFCFQYMFSDCESLKTAPSLPAENLPYCCYKGMFNNCESLEYGPSILPAKSVGDSCYYSMFEGCKSLKKIPEIMANSVSVDSCINMFAGCILLTEASIIPATSLERRCYVNMFKDCTSLQIAPFLPATSLKEDCYESMFEGCTSLKEAPELPASYTARGCYRNMFKGCISLENPPVIKAKLARDSSFSCMFKDCTSLKATPELKSVTLERFCYAGMFDGCTSLTESPALIAEKAEYGCYEDMFNGCTSLKNPPAIKASSMSDLSCHQMFKDCTSLLKAPELLATELGNRCYESMFAGCTNLATPPSQLPAIMIPSDVYKCMFLNCKMLEDIPYIAAINLKSEFSRPFDSMFAGCDSLKISSKKTDTNIYPFIVYTDMHNIFGDSGLNGIRSLLSRNIYKDVYYKSTKFGNQDYASSLNCINDEQAKSVIIKYSIPLIPNTGIPDLRNANNMSNRVLFESGRIKDKFPKYTETTTIYRNRVIDSVIVEYNEVEERADCITDKIIRDRYLSYGGELIFHSSESISSIMFK